MNLLTTDFLVALAGAYRGPCVTLYQPTHRHRPENQQDPIRFRSLVKELERSLEKKYPDYVGSLLLPFEALGDDDAFWNHTMDGLAVFGAPRLFRVFGLQRPVQELAVVGDNYQTKPLRRFLQSVDRYQLLGVSRHEITLFEGNREALDQIDLAPGVLRAISDAVGSDWTKSNPSVESYGSGEGVGSPTRVSQGQVKTELDNAEDRFFRAVDRAVLELHSRPTGLPLILAASPEQDHRFHLFSDNPFLVAEGLKVHPDDLPVNELRERAWRIFEPHYRARLATLAEAYAVAKSKGLGIDELNDVTEAAVAGRVETLLIEADRLIAGRIHPGTGYVDLATSGQAFGDDLLDDTGEWVLRKGGRVVVVPAASMPTKTGAAAALRG